MPDDPSKVGAQDRSRINIHQNYELDYWSQHFGVPKERLKAAVEKVGPSVKAVEEELRRR
jgi:hypothetical protein